MEQGLASEVLAAAALIASALLVTTLYYPGLDPSLLLVVAGLTSVYAVAGIARPWLIAAYIAGCAGAVAGPAWLTLLCLPLALTAVGQGRRYWGLAPLLLSPTALAMDTAAGIVVGVAAAFTPLAWAGFRARLHSIVYTVGLLAATAAYVYGVEAFYYYSLATAASVYSVLAGRGFTRCPFRVEFSSLVVAQGVMAVAALAAAVPGFVDSIAPLLYAAGYYTFTASLLAPTRVSPGGERAGTGSNT